MEIVSFGLKAKLFIISLLLKLIRFIEKEKKMWENMSSVWFVFFLNSISKRAYVTNKPPELFD